MSTATTASSRKPTIALTTGDPAGIGPELVLRLLADPATAARANVILIGNTPALQRAASATGLPMPQASDWLTLAEWPLQATQYAPAVAAEANGKFILESLTLGARMVTEGDADALCFAPLNKGAMRRAACMKKTRCAGSPNCSTTTACVANSTSWTTCGPGV